MEKNRESLSLDRKVTSRDVARVAGVSQSTVSRVFSDVNSVKPELKERVYRAAKEIGYRPNLVARGMISGKTNVIGLVVGDNLDPFYNRIINKFAEAIQKMGKQCLIFKVPRQDQLGKIVERVLQFQVEAVIVTASAMTKVMAEVILENNVPVILFNRFIPGLDISTVYVDAVNGATTVAEYLYQKGHRNIGYIQYIKETGEELEKKIGFYSKLRQYGIFQIKEETAEYDYQSGFEAGIRLLSGEDAPSAIFCTSDLIALGVMDAARKELGLRIPEDVAIIGYDDIEMSSWESYSLTSVHQPVEEMIEKTMEILDNLLKGEKRRDVKMFNPVLKQRNSV